MLFKVDDGKAVFATHFLRCIVNRDDEQVRNTLTRFQVEADGIVCYSQEEADAARAALDELKITYTVEPQVVDQAVRDRASGRRYSSRSEAVQDLTFIAAVADPNPATTNVTVVVRATLFPDPLDTEVTFQVEGGTPITEPVYNGQASHAYAFVQPGVYRIVVSSAHHGTAVVEVTVL